MRRLPTYLLPFLLLATSAAAQTTFRLGLRGGANRATSTVDVASNADDTYTNTSASKAALFAWQAGVVGELAFGKLALQPALVFTQKGEQFHTLLTSRDSGFPYRAERNSTSRYNWLELPLNLVYTLHGDHGLQVLAGPYVALAVGGRQQVEESSSSVVGPYAYTAPLEYGPATANRRLDAGLNFGLGYRQGPVQLQLSYGLGLRNLHMNNPMIYAVGGAGVHDFQADAAYNRITQLTATYFFQR